MTNKVGCLSNVRALGSVCVRLRLARECRPDVTSVTALRKNPPPPRQFILVLDNLQ